MVRKILITGAKHKRKGEETMVRKILITGLFVVTMIVLATYDANAVWINGVWVAKGVECLGESIVKNIDKNKVTVLCDAEPLVSQECPENSPNAIVVCMNQGGNISHGRAFVNLDIFGAALTIPFTADRKGKIVWDAILTTEGIDPPDPGRGFCDEGDKYCYCDYDTTCSALRANCPNLNWRPVDVVPICMTATAASYYCDSDLGYHTCPCDPTITDLTNPKACASNLGGGNPPWTYSWSGTPVPLAREVSECFLPDPGTWIFGERRPYSCEVVSETN